MNSASILSFLCFSVSSKKKWSEEEKIGIKDLVQRAVENKKPPRKSEVENAKKKHEVLRNIPWIQIKHQTWAMAQQKLRLALKLHFYIENLNIGTTNNKKQPRKSEFKKN